MPLLDPITGWLVQVFGDALLKKPADHKRLREVVERAIDRVTAEQDPDLRDGVARGLRDSFTLPLQGSVQLGGGSNLHLGFSEAVAAQVELLRGYRQLSSPRQMFLEAVPVDLDHLKQLMATAVIEELQASFAEAGLDNLGIALYLSEILARVQALQARTSPPPTRSKYKLQIEQIAPPRLIGRETELADLAAFCTAEGGPNYLWFVADAWFGKSALMSTFALEPPDGVDVVAFFITARLSGQSSRPSFFDTVAEQCAAMLEEPQPLAAATTNTTVLDLLYRAAEKSRAQGRRLVLVVDGLDEDQGEIVAGQRHSIAAALPARCPGLRVIVASRPNPPIPVDVPQHHPLRDEQIRRPLSPSPAAEATRQEARQDLDRFLPQ